MPAAEHGPEALAAMLRAAGFPGVEHDKSPSAVADGLGVFLISEAGDAGTRLGLCRTGLPWPAWLIPSQAPHLEGPSVPGGNPKLPRAHVGAAVSLALIGDVPAARRAADDLLRLVRDHRLSRTMDASLPSSPPQYQAFYAGVLRSGAVLAEVPI